MNRKERRAARHEGEMILVNRGHLLPLDPNHGLPVRCYVCNAAHKARGIVRIEDKSSILNAPLCDACLNDDSHQQIMRKFLNAPDFEISEVTIQ